MFVAAEVLNGASGRPGLALRAPWVVAFVFGLLHGLGFAGALRQIGLPEHEIPLALFCFNVGVELGQLLFIGAVMAVLALLARGMARGQAEGRDSWQAEAMLRTPVAYVVGSVAAFWVMQRVAAFWP
jgi:hydrogenase/urease accessory protein HupE